MSRIVSKYLALRAAHRFLPVKHREEAEVISVKNSSIDNDALLSAPHSSPPHTSKP